MKFLKSKQAGMTLVEILAVIVLIALIMGVVAKGVFGKSEAAKAQLNMVRMQNVQSALAQYRLQYNVYPSSLDELAHPKDSTDSGIIAVPLVDEKELKDIWGSAYIYRSEGGRSYTLSSLGSDGTNGGEGGKKDVTLTP